MKDTCRTGRTDDRLILCRLTGLPLDVVEAIPTLADLLITDNLTGLFNRTYFQERVQQELLLANENSLLALIILDADHLKQLNDSYGHEAGDKALQEIAAAMRLVLPERALPCRFAGDEFAVLIPATTRAEAEWYTMELIQEIARRQLLVGPTKPPIGLSASAGMAVAPLDGQTAVQLFQRADQAMYRSKHGPRLRFEKVTGDTAAPLHAERTELLRQFAHMLEQVSRGQGELLCLTGPARTGPGRLSGAMAEQARQSGFTVLRTASTASPLQPFRQVSDQLIRQIGRARISILSTEEWAVTALMRFRRRNRSAAASRCTVRQIAEGLSTLLGEAASHHPVLWLLDGLSVGNLSALAVLEQLAPYLEGRQILIAVTVRIEEPGTGQAPFQLYWRRLAQLPACTHWSFPPAISLGIDREQIEGCVERYRKLEEFHRTILALAAVIGPLLTIPIMLQAAPAPMREIKRAVTTLVRTGWLLRSGEKVRFAHPILLETALRCTSPFFQRTLHRLAGQALAVDNEASAARIALHFDLGGDWEQAYRSHLAAAEAAEAEYAFTEAAHHYRRSFYLSELVPGTAEHLPRLALKAATSLEAINEHSAALAFLQQTVQGTGAEAEQARILLRMARLHLILGQPERCWELHDQAITMLRPHGPSTDLAVALMHQVSLEAQRNNRTAAIAVASEAIHLSASFNDPETELMITAGVGCYLCEAKEEEFAAQCLDLAREQVKRLPRKGDPRTARAVFNIASLATRLGQQPEAVRLSGLARKMAAGGGDLQVLVGAHELEVRNLILSGSLARAKERLVQTELLSSRGSFSHLLWLELSCLAALYGHDLEAASWFAGRLEDVSRALTPGLNRYGQALQLLVEMTRGAKPPVSDWDPIQLTEQVRGIQATPVLLIAAQIHLKAGAISAAQQLVDGARKALVMRYDLPWVDWMQGRIYQATPDKQRALRWLRRAANQKGNLYFRALAYLDLIIAHPQGQNHPPGLRTASRMWHRLGNRWGLAQIASWSDTELEKEFTEKDITE